MKHVLSGIKKFQEEVFPERRALFDKLAGGQHPPILLVTCADSRIDPSLITQTEPGYLFICRNAGNVVPPHSQTTGGVTASIEYAVAVLGVKHIIVCGHTDCGAIKAATQLEQLDDLPHVKEWLTHCRAAVETVRYRHGTVGPENLAELTKENVLAQVHNLRTHPVVAARFRSGLIRLHAWVYDIESAEVFCYDEEHDSWPSVFERQAALIGDEELESS